MDESVGITELLLAWNQGDERALQDLMPLVHDELHRLAHAYMRREPAGHPLQTLRSSTRRISAWSTRAVWSGRTARISLRYPRR